MNYTKIIFFLCFCVIFTHCAKRGFPEGGPKDESPPVLVNANPKENSINFDEKRIRLFFDEYINLNFIIGSILVLFSIIMVMSKNSLKQ